MSQIWTTPKTWVSEPLTSTDLNTHLRDNLDFLKNPPTAVHAADQASDYQTTSASFVAVDSTHFDFSLTTAGGAVLLSFYGVMRHSDTGAAFMDVAVDGVRQGGNDGLVVAHWPTVDNRAISVCFQHLVTGLSAFNAHTFELMWRVAGGSVTLFAGAGTTQRDCIPQFWVREVS